MTSRAYTPRPYAVAATGQVLRREDGKIIKPEGWRPPNLARLLEQCHG